MERQKDSNATERKRYGDKMRINISEGEEKENGAASIFEEKILEKLPKLIKTTSHKSQKPWELQAGEIFKSPT